MLDSVWNEMRSMKRQGSSRFHGCVRGFSLIELMVSLTIGLIIVIAVISAYLGSSSAARMAEAQARMNEDAQAVLNILAQQIRMAGDNPLHGTDRNSSFRYNPVYSTSYVGGATFTYPGTLTLPGTFTLSNFSIRGCDGNFSNITATATLDGLTCAGSTSTLPDSIAVNYEADQFNTVATNAGAATDCLGNALGTVTVTFPAGTATTATYAVADNRFYLGTPTSGVPSLYCKGNGGAGTPQPLVENVEDLQFTYGTVSASNTSTTATVAGYLSAYSIVNDANLSLLPIEQRWGKVLTVRICVLVRSENPVAPDANAAKYDDCQGNTNVAAPDLRLRRAYTTTVVLRNRRR